MTGSLSTQLLDSAFQWLTTSGLRVVAVGLGMLVLFFVARGTTSRLRTMLQGALPSPEQVKRAETLAHVVQDVARVLIVAVGSLMILSELGLNVAPLLAAAGIGGLAVGFGAQSLVKDMITGFFILLENQIRVGDVVEIAGVGGVVEEVRLRTIRLRDLSGNFHIVPNGSVDKVMNYTYLYILLPLRRGRRVPGGC